MFVGEQRFPLAGHPDGTSRQSERPGAGTRVAGLAGTPEGSSPGHGSLIMERDRKTGGRERETEREKEEKWNIVAAESGSGLISRTRAARAGLRTWPANGRSARLGRSGIARFELARVNASYCLNG